MTMDFVAIVTPNHVHYGPAKAALEHGFHVMSDKPATFNSDEARELVGFDEFKNVARVLAAFVARPAVERGLQITAAPK